MKISAEGIHALEKREGVRTRAYKDIKGVWTIGVGHTSMAGPPHVFPGMIITMQQVDEILSRDLVKYERIVLNALKREPTQNQFDALVSLCFNTESALGPASSVVREFNRNHMQAAADNILKYNKVKINGVLVKSTGLANRRKSERAQFLGE